MPDKAINLSHLDAALMAFLIDQTQLDPISDLAEQGEVGTRSIVACTEWVRFSGPDLHG